MFPTTYKVNMNSLLHLAGIIAEVTTVLAAEGIALCSCVVRGFTLNLASKNIL